MTQNVLTGGLVVLAIGAITLVALDRRGQAASARLWFATLARLVLAGYLGVAGLLKLPHPAESVRAVRAYRILPESIVPTVGYVLPLLEVGLAVLLVLGLATRTAAVIASVLMVAFIIGIASVAARGISIDCGCFGGGGEVAEGATKYTQEIIRDVGLLVLGLLLVYRPGSRLSLDHTDELDDFDDLDLNDTDRDNDGPHNDDADGQPTSDGTPNNVTPNNATPNNQENRS
jgi:uncharacterized membrane protein YphA (DoxX/SURF4 family)